MTFNFWLSPSPLTVSAPAKVILFGEHAVVYGQPALAVPVSSIRVTVSVTPSAATPIFAAGDWTRDFPSDIHADQLTNPVLRMAKLTAAHLRIDVPPARYEIASQIPVASGLGSGAAVSAAVGRAIAAAAGTSIPDDVSTRSFTKSSVSIMHAERHRQYGDCFENQFISCVQTDRGLHGRCSASSADRDTGRSALTKESVGEWESGRYAPEFAQPRIERIGQVANLAATRFQMGISRKLVN